MRLVSLIAVCLSVGDVATATAAKLDSSSLGGSEASNSKKGTGAAAPAHSEKAKQSLIQSGAPANETSEAEGRELVESLDLLLQKAPGGTQEIKLRLSRAQAILGVARATLLRSKETKMGAAEAGTLATARSDVAKVLKMAGLSAGDRAQALYLAGLSYVYSDTPAKALPFLEKAHASFAAGDPTREWIGIYLAEELFEDGQFAKALPYYVTAAQTQSSYLWLARYKAAWCNLNLRKIPEAESAFSQIARSPKSGSFGSDSLKDLAFLSARFRSDAEVLALVQRLGLRDEARTDFLRRVQGQREAQNDMDPKSELFRSLLATEKDPASRVKLWISVVRGTYRQYADSRHLDSLSHVFEEIRKAGWKADTAAFADVADIVDQEAQRLLRSFVETYAGRTKTPDSALQKPSVLAAPLERVFALYAAYFPKSPRLPAILELRSEICESEKNWACVRQSAQQLLDLPAEALKPADRQAANLRLIEACDHSHAFDGTQKTPDAVCREAIEIFVTERVQAPEWPEVAAKLAELKLKEGHADEARALLEALWKKSPKAPTFVRLQRLRFDDGLFDEVLADPRNAALARDPELRGILREAHLKKAKQSKDGGTEADYRKHLESFLALNPDPAKAALARADLVRFLLEKGSSSAAVKELLPLKPVDRLRVPFRALVIDTALERLKVGDSSGAEILWKGGMAKGRDLALLQAYTDVSRGRWPAALPTLSASERAQVLGLLAVSRPQVAISGLASKKKLDAHERTLLLFALRLAHGKQLFPVDAKLARLLGSSLPATMRSAAEFPLMAAIGKVPLISAKARGRAIERGVEKASGPLRRLRARYTKEAGRLPTAYRVQSAGALAAREKALGEAILRSPLPAGLAAAEKEKYKAAIADAAKEFLDQAAQYERIVQESSEAAAEGETAASVPFSNFSEESWPWPASAGFPLDQWRKDARSGHLDRALVGLEAARIRGLDAKEALAIRAGLVLSAYKSEPARRFVYDELKGGGREDLLESKEGA